MSDTPIGDRVLIDLPKLMRPHPHAKPVNVTEAMSPRFVLLIVAVCLAAVLLAVVAA
jgi:hypothetical protein